MFDHLKKRKRSRNPLFPVVVIVVVLAGALGGYIGVKLAMAKLGGASESEVAQPATPAPSVTPTPTPVVIAEAAVQTGLGAPMATVTPDAVATEATPPKAPAKKKAARKASRRNLSKKAAGKIARKRVAALTPTKDLATPTPAPTPEEEKLEPGDLPDGLDASLGEKNIALTPTPKPAKVVDLKKRHIQPIAVFNPQPPYPELARKHNLGEGQVIVEIVVDEQGAVQDATVVKSQPPFDQPAINSVLQWKFKPVVVKGEAVVWKYRLAMRFQPTT